MDIAVITPAEMYRAEQAVFDTGVSSFSVMRMAGEAVGQWIQESYPTGRIRVLCGPGGNGGDGFVAAAYLAARGRQVSIYLLGDMDQLTGDIEKAATLWSGPCAPLAEAVDADTDITIDALFGGGLSRPIAGIPAQLAVETGGQVVSIDVPSGLDGLTAKPLGPCFTADLTVTFAALRPAHVLSPGRAYCGAVHVAEIGVPVPTRTLLRQGMPQPPEATIIAPDLATLNGLITGNDPHPANRIEAVRLAATRQNRAVLLQGPETLLALPDGQVMIHSAS